MSGGVDSSVVALLLLEQGYDVVGVTFKQLPGENREIADAKKVADYLGIEHHVIDIVDEFSRCVIEPFIDAYIGGLTPNPCVECNKTIKFGFFLEQISQFGCNAMATGHYVKKRIDGADGWIKIERAKDPLKDQSYFLHHLTQKQLSMSVFPLGGFLKTEIKEIASKAGLPSAKSHESQDICFIDDNAGGYVSFIEKNSSYRCESGDVLNTSGQVIGQHLGALKYTLGQRKGIGVAIGQPAYVCAKDMVNNTVTIGVKQDLEARGCSVDSWNWALPEDERPTKVLVKTHYRQKLLPATLNENDKTMVVEFDDPCVLPSPGQYAVAYDGDIVVGGGEITTYIK